VVQRSTDGPIGLLVETAVRERGQITLYRFDLGKLKARDPSR
jgi:hypothetical protein